MASGTHLKRYFTLAVLLALASAVMLLSWPRFAASYRYLPVDLAIARYLSSREIPSARLDVLIRFAREALEHEDSYRYHDGLSVLHLLRATDLNTLALERRDAYLASMEEAVQSLERAPAQPATWLRLANVHWLLHDEPEDIVGSWKMSIFTGRTNSTLFVQRMELGLAHRAYMDAEAIAMLRDQLLLAWRTQPGSLVKVLSKWDRDLAVTRPLLESTDPVALHEMEAWLAKLP